MPLSHAILPSMATREEIMELWPELDWIENEDIREKTLATWMLAFERSPLEPQDLLEMPFTLHVPDCEVSFMAHKRLVVHLALDSAKKIKEFMGDAMPIDQDILISGAILADVGKLLEYEKEDGELKQSRRGKYLRHPFTGVGLAQEVGVPDAACHIIAT
ncbi:MAG: phosphohydrolase, partial [Planctomycetota bacterium]|nr:phosphohydrolase [Planctomycetota bacterium]